MDLHYKIIYFHSFKEVTFNFSIDAYGNKNDLYYIPSKWTDIGTLIILR